MADVIPPVNASPEATPFLRWVEKSITDIQTANGYRDQSDLNVNMGMSATLDSLGKTIIGLETALAAVIYPESSVNGVNNVAVTTTATVVTSVTFKVPAGYTKAQITAISTAQAYNNNTSGDYLYCQTIVNGSSGGELYSWAPAGGSTGVTAPNFGTVWSLTAGQVITVSTEVRSGTSGWAASTGMEFNIYATVLFLN